jgi:hypothetical protein
MKSKPKRQRRKDKTLKFNSFCFDSLMEYGDLVFSVKEKF